MHGLAPDTVAGIVGSNPDTFHPTVLDRMSAMDRRKVFFSADCCRRALIITGRELRSAPQDSLSSQKPEELAVKDVRCLEMRDVADVRDEHELTIRDRVGDV